MKVTREISKRPKRHSSFLQKATQFKFLSSNPEERRLCQKLWKAITIGAHDNYGISEFQSAWFHVWGGFRAHAGMLGDYIRC